MKHEIDQHLETKSLMARRGRHEFPFSRGFEEPIKCQVKTCPMNNGSRLCLMPTMASIGADGTCETWVKYKEKTNG
jgi:hypothetical protein